MPSYTLTHGDHIPPQTIDAVSPRAARRQYRKRCGNLAPTTPVYKPAKKATEDATHTADGN